MFITKKHLSRRTLLRGAGAAIALPLLDSMVPAQTPLRKTAAARRVPASLPSRWCTARREAPRRRRRSTTGRRPPKEVAISNSALRCSRSSPIRDYITIVSDTDLNNASALSPRRRRRRPHPLFRRVPDRRAPEDDGGLGHLCWARRSTRSMRSTPARTAAPLPSIQLCIEMSDRFPAPAVTAIAVSTPIRSAGLRPRSRCRWRSTRAWLSSVSSAMARRPPSGSPGAAGRPQHPGCNPPGCRAPAEGSGRQRSQPPERLSR